MASPIFAAGAPMLPKASNVGGFNAVDLVYLVIVIVVLFAPLLLGRAPSPPESPDQGSDDGGAAHRRLRLSRRSVRPAGFRCPTPSSPGGACAATGRCFTGRGSASAPRTRRARRHGERPCTPDPRRAAERDS